MNSSDTITLKTIYTNAINLIYLDCAYWKYDDSIKANFFDFDTFSASNAVQEGHSYELFYKNKQLLKVRRNNSITKEIYDFYFFYTQDIIYYIANPVSDEYLIGSVRGFFTYDKITKQNYFFGIDSEFQDKLGINSETNQCQQMALTVDIKKDFDNIRTIMLLNRALRPLKRMNCINSKIVNYSDFISKDDGLYERLIIVDGCKSVEIGKRKFKDLKKVISNYEEEERRGFAVEIKVPKEPIWRLTEFGYY